MEMILVVESEVVESEVETVGGGTFCAWRRKPDRMEVEPWRIGWKWQHGMSLTFVLPIAYFTLTVELLKLIVVI